MYTRAFDSNYNFIDFFFFLYLALYIRFRQITLKNIMDSLVVKPTYSTRRKSNTNEIGTASGRSANIKQTHNAIALRL